MTTSVKLIGLLSLGLLCGCSKPKDVGHALPAVKTSQLEKSATGSDVPTESRPTLERIFDIEPAIQAMGFDRVFAFRFRGRHLKGWLQLDSETGPQKHSLETSDASFPEKPTQVSGTLVIALRKSSSDPQKRECVWGLNLQGAMPETNPPTFDGGSVSTQFGLSGTVPIVLKSAKTVGLESRSIPFSHHFPWKEGEEDWELFRIWLTNDASDYAHP
jgi:hypothetical protein